MQPLTAREWQQHFARLRPAILERWPLVDSQELEAIDNDYDGLVEVIQRATGYTAEAIHTELRALDVDDLPSGTGAGGQPSEEPAGVVPASLAQLRLGTGFAEDERDRIVARLDKLNRRLKRFPADDTNLQLSVKDRESTEQKVTLECRVPGFGNFVVTSRETDLRAALADVREDLWRRLDDAVNRRKEGVS